MQAEQQGLVLRVESRDTGSGIAQNDLPLVFDRFYRADKSRQRIDAVSSGLGLAIVKAIVEAHGGTIDVESAVGKGTTFTITLLPAVHTKKEATDSTTHGTRVAME